VHVFKVIGRGLQPGAIREGDVGLNRRAAAERGRDLSVREVVSSKVACAADVVEVKEVQFAKCGSRCQAALMRKLIGPKLLRDITPRRATTVEKE
jgi:hypothetical protein